MKDYIQGKEDECCSVRKQKIIDKEAVSEVLDDDGNVVRPAEAEESHEELQLVKKQFNPMNGQALDDMLNLLKSLILIERLHKEMTKYLGYNQKKLIGKLSNQT